MEEKVVMEFSKEEVGVIAKALIAMDIKCDEGYVCRECRNRVKCKARSSAYLKVQGREI